MNYLYYDNNNTNNDNNDYRSLITEEWGLICVIGLIIVLSFSL